MKKNVVILIVLLSLVSFSLSGCLNNSDDNGNDNENGSNTVIQDLNEVWYSFVNYDDKTNLPNSSYLIIPLIVQNENVIEISLNELSVIETRESSLISDFKFKTIDTEYGKGLKVTPIPTRKDFSTTKDCTNFELNVSNPSKSRNIPFFSLQDNFESPTWIFTTHNISSFYMELIYYDDYKIAISTDLKSGWQQYEVQFWVPIAE